MKKAGLLNLLRQITIKSKSEEIDDARPLEVLSLILDYLNDKDVREAVDEVLM